jgi:hypothetical protein
MRALAPRTARAPVCGSAIATAAAEDVGHWNADHQGTKWVVLFNLAGFERYELDRASAVHPRCCCASCIAGTLLERRQLRPIVLL